MGNWPATTWRRLGPRARDLGFIIVAALSAVGPVMWRDSVPPAKEHAVLIVCTVATLALWWRRRAPVSVALVGLGAHAATEWPVVLGIALFTVAIERRDRVLVALTVLAAVTVAVVAIDGGARTRPAEAIILGIVGPGFCVAAGAYVGTRRDLVASWRDRAARAEAEQELRAEQARLAERARIAGEMHDVLAHKVSLIALHAGGLEVHDVADTAQVHATADLIGRTAREAMDDLRDVLGLLRVDGTSPDGRDVAPQPDAAAIRRVVDASCAAGVAAELTMTVDVLPDSLARSAHRIVREGLTNVHKHAGGAATAVAVTGDADDGLTVEIVNERPRSAVPLLPSTGIGLVGLRERVALSGGSLEFGPWRNGGWRLAAWLPWPADSSAGRPG